MVVRILSSFLLGYRQIAEQQSEKTGVVRMMGPETQMQQNTE